MGHQLISEDISLKQPPHLLIHERWRNYYLYLSHWCPQGQSSYALQASKAKHTTLYYLWARNTSLKCCYNNLPSSRRNISLKALITWGDVSIFYTSIAIVYFLCSFLDNFHSSKRVQISLFPFTWATCASYYLLFTRMPKRDDVHGRHKLSKSQFSLKLYLSKLRLKLWYL